MRSTDERMAAVARRTRALKQRQRQRRSRLVGISATLAALALVVGAGLGMPGVMAEMDRSEQLGVSAMASIFSEGSELGYVVIALLAFALGVCVTMLCLHLHRTEKAENPRADQEESGG